MSASCAALGRPCAPGFQCVCSPCAPIPDELVSVFIVGRPPPGSSQRAQPSGSLGALEPPAAGADTLPGDATAGQVLAASRPCRRLELCATVPLGQPLTVFLRVDLAARAGLGLQPIRSVQLRFLGPAASAAADASAAPLVDLQEVPSEPGIFFFAAPSGELGVSTVHLVIDGETAPQDPLYVRVAPRLCVVDGRVVASDAAGVCRAPSDPPDAVRITSIAVPTCGFALVVLVACLTRRLTIAHAAARWARRDEEERKLKAALQSILAEADSEKDILAAALDAAQRVFHGASGAAAGVFRDELCSATSLVEGVATTLEGQLALLSSLPEDVGSFREGPGERQNSVWFACDCVDGSGGDGPAADSAALPGGIEHFADWAEARRLGLDTARAVTSAISADDVVLGFVTVHLPGARRARGENPEALRILGDLCQIVGSALFVRRALVGVGVDTKGGDDDDQQQAVLSAAAAAGLGGDRVAQEKRRSSGALHHPRSPSGPHHPASPAELAAHRDEAAAHSGKRQPGARGSVMDAERPATLRAVVAHFAETAKVRAEETGASYVLDGKMLISTLGVSFQPLSVSSLSHTSPSTPTQTPTRRRWSGWTPRPPPPASGCGGGTWTRGSSPTTSASASWSGCSTRRASCGSSRWPRRG